MAPVCPILLVHGSEDNFVALKHSQKLNRRLSIPRRFGSMTAASTTRGVPDLCGNQPVCRVHPIILH